MTVASNHFCIFEVGKEFFAAAAKQIREVTSKPSFAAVPGVAPVVAGLWHEGSEFVPVLRLPFLRSENSHHESQILVVHGAAGRWALLVDQVHNIAAIEVSRGGGETGQPSVVMGMSQWNGHSVRVVNLDALYRSAEEGLQQHWLEHAASVG